MTDYNELWDAVEDVRDLQGYSLEPHEAKTLAALRQEFDRARKAEKRRSG